MACEKLQREIQVNLIMSIYTFGTSNHLLAYIRRQRGKILQVLMNVQMQITEVAIPSKLNCHW